MISRHARRRDDPGSTQSVTGLLQASASGDQTALDELLPLVHDDLRRRLAELDARKSKLVELRYFGGLGIEEAAAALGISPATVKREWTTAQAWLRRELSVA